MVQSAKKAATDLENTMGQAGQKSGQALAKKLVDETTKGIVKTKTQMVAAAREIVAEIDPIAKAQLAHANAVTKANIALSAGYITESQHADFIKKSKNALEEETKALAKNGSAVALNRMQMMELAHVGRSVFDGLAAGQSPMRILTMESARLGQALGSGEGGVAGGIAALGGMAVEFAPIIAIVGVLAAAAGGVGLAFHAAAEEADALRQATVTLDMMGNGAKYSAEEVAKVADGIRATGVSAKDANAELRTFIQNNVAPDRLESFATAAREMAKVLGEDTTKAAQELSTAFTGTYKDMMSVKDVAEALDEKDKAYIKTLYDSGRASEARSEAFRIYSEKVGKAYNDSLTESDRLQHAVAGSWAALTSAMGNTSAVQAATNVINGLLNSMTSWLRQYEAVKALSASDLKAEQDRLYAKLSGPNSDKAYRDEAARGVLREQAIRITTGIDVGAPSVKDLRARDEARMMEIEKQLHPLATGDTTIQPHVDAGGGSGGGKTTFTPTSGFVKDGFAPDLEAGKLLKNPNANTGYEAPFWELKAAPIKDATKSIDELKTKLPELIDPMEAVRQELAGIGQEVGQAFGDAIAYGDNLGQALGNVFRRIAADYVSSGVENIFDSLMGITASGGKASSGGGLMSFLGSELHIPGFATGTPFAPGGLSLVGERGPELVNLPRGSVVHNATATRAMLSNIGGGGVRAPEMAVRVYVDDNGNLNAAIERGARRVAQPMAEQAATAGAMGGSALAQQNLMSRARRKLG